MTELTIFICPRCQQRAMRMPHTGDFEHKCHGQEVLKNEDVLVIGDWQDYTGSDTTVGPNAIHQSTENRLFGTRPWLEGDKETPQRTSRGFPKTRYRTRQHLHFIESGFFKEANVKRVDNPEDFIGDS